MIKEHQYYDQGWNDYLRGVEYDYRATRDWKDGWEDCQMADLEDQVFV